MRFLGVLVCSLAVGFASTATAVPLYDATADFSIAGNPNGVWTYGFYNNAGTVFTPYAGSTSAWHGNADLDAWSQFGYDSSSYSVVGKNVVGTVEYESGGGSIEVEPGTLFTHPGNGGEKGTIRFTAPATGIVNINALFDATDTIGGNRDVHVYVNGVDAIPGSLVVGSKSTATAVNYSAMNLPITAGTIIDFAVGYGSDAVYFNDATFLSATVEYVPEPSSIALLVTGACAALFVRRRKA